MNNTWWIRPEELDRTQKSVIDLPLESSHLILGPPGCGKTNLLLLRASQLFSSGIKNVVVLVFTRPLREFIVSGGSHYAFTGDKVQTMSSWSIDFLREHGVEPYQDRDFSKQRVGRVEQIASVISSQKVEDFYDAIVLDEAQDYTEAEMVLFFKLAKVVFAAADSRQQIYQTGGAATHNLEAMFTGNVFRLKHHYRNGHAICRLADALAASWKGFDEMMPTSNYDEVKYPSSVNVHRCVDLSAQLDKALDSVQRQAKAYPNELLGLLAPRAALASISALIKASPLASNVILQTADEGYVPFSQSKHTCLCSVHGAKGLEFRTVHLLDAEAVGKGASLRRKITYTAVTRAKTSLAIYHTESLPAYFDGALAKQAPPLPAARLDQLFKGS